ncbi:MAG TPA: haloacid dehalogenase type II [Ktedonobacterales bacterium]|jgi:2-haloacid dehalogenase
MAVREALAFDMYSTLVDTIGIRKQIERLLPAQAQRTSEIWRQTQLEFSFRLTLMGRYEDFAYITRKALDYTLAVTRQELDAAQKDTLMAQYNALEPFPDVKPGLAQLQAAGFQMIIFSNGAPAMLNALLDSAGLRPYFQDIVSANEIRVYKPSPRLYQHAAQRLGRPIGETRLISANPFDVSGALNAGMLAALVNRSGAPLDPLGSRPDVIVGTLTELAERLAQGA